MTKIGAFAQVMTAKLTSGIVETKQLLIDGVDVKQRLDEQEAQIEKQQQDIEQLREEFRSVKK